MYNTNKTNTLKVDTVKDRIKRQQALFVQEYKLKACNISATCQAIGINRLTFYDWKSKYPEFEIQITELEQGMIDLAETQLFKNIRDGKETSLIFFLCNKARDKWQNVQRIEHKLPTNTKMTYIIKHAK
jgi:transposase-like protein